MWTVYGGSMLRITPTTIRTWADELGTPNNMLAELDLNLLQILDAITSNSTLRNKLYLKGGTAINKLYLKDLSRFSVDIDLNHVGSKHDVLTERTALHNQVKNVILADNSAYIIKDRKRRYEQTTIHVYYQSLVNGLKQHIKIEISHIERFPILLPVKRQVRLPRGHSSSIITYQLEELIATKIRALHDRRKGRDVYDLWSLSRSFTPDLAVIRKLFLYYFYKSQKAFNPKVFFPNLFTAAAENAFDDDVSNFKRPDIKFDLQTDTHCVINWLRFLYELDEDDHDFIYLARVLLNKGAIPKRKRKAIENITHPLTSLFHNINQITVHARDMTTNEIAPVTTK
jgi:predicted nucleotidyltransferase component of viral defense system